MDLIELIPRKDIAPNTKVEEVYVTFDKLIMELSRINMPDSIIRFINISIESVNTNPNLDKQFSLLVKKHQIRILRLLEKKLKVVPINHYRNLWLALGMAIFGISIGVALGTVFHQMAFLGIGLPIGLSIGMAIGAGMDKKAKAEGRQINIEFNY